MSLPPQSRSFEIFISRTTSVFVDFRHTSVGHSQTRVSRLASTSAASSRDRIASMSHMAETSLKQIEAARQLAPEATACLRPVLETLYAHGQNASATGDDAAVQFGVDVTAVAGGIAQNGTQLLHFHVVFCHGNEAVIGLAPPDVHAGGGYDARERAIHNVRRVSK